MLSSRDNDYRCFTFEIFTVSPHSLFYSNVSLISAIIESGRVNSTEIVNIVACERKSHFPFAERNYCASGSRRDTRMKTGKARRRRSSCRGLTFTSMLTHRLSLIGKPDKYERERYSISSVITRRFIYSINFNSPGTR